MNAEIVSVGTELLLGQIVDTHAPTMARLLAECGIGCTRRTTIGDNWDRLVGALRESLSRADLVITIGGLGPTSDDMTRDGIAAALDDELERVPEVEQRLRDFFGSRGYKFAESNLKQADKPKCGRQIDNPNGTAPGLICEKGGKVVIALPGPKGEFDPMAHGPVREYLERLQGGGVIHSRTLRVIGVGESMMEERVKHLMDNENPTLAPYAQTSECHLRLTARAATREEADRLIDPIEAQVRAILGTAVYAINDTTLEAALIELLVSRGETVSVAESMTGGQLGARLSSTPGSSKAFVGGAIVYTPAMKESALGIDPSLIASFGPVSAEVASAMASNALSRFGSTYAVAISGNAGPTADVDGKPVGLTYIAIAGPGGVKVSEGKYRGLREDIRFRASHTALAMLRDRLLEG
jgi:competence/damage-inducible protein CinA-like protein